MTAKSGRPMVVAHFKVRSTFPGTLISCRLCHFEMFLQFATPTDERRAFMATHLRLRHPELNTHDSAADDR